MISLRPLKPTDHIALYSIYSNKRITRPAGFLPYQFQHQLNEHMDEFLKTHTAIINNQQLVGVITQDLLDEHSISIGIMIHENYQHQGIGKNALNQYLELMKTKKINTVYADCIINNIASQKLLESCGFSYLNDFKRRFPDFIDEKTCKLYIKRL